MRIACEIVVCDRQLQLSDAQKRKRTARASLAIGRPPCVTNARRGIHVLVCTASNLTGIRYSACDNVEHVFDKFARDGRATIRFRAPPHDLYVSKADPLQLKSFLKFLHLAVKGLEVTSDGEKNAVVQCSMPRLLSSATVGLMKAPKTRLVIGDRNSYLQLDGFPVTLTVLQISQCALHKVDPRITKLKQLRILNLSHNELSVLPDKLSSLEYLQELDISNNKLAFIPASLFSRNHLPSLRSLNLSHNDLESVPSELCSLRQLSTLRLDNNRLSCLPERIFMLQNLLELTASDNRLLHLPGGVLFLRLTNLDISKNPYQSTLKAKQVTCRSDKVPPLLELSARSALTHR